MVEQGNGHGAPSDLEQLARQSEGSGDAWEQTIRDMRVTAKERGDEGYKTQTIPAGHTAPKSPQAGDTDRFGLTHVIPDNQVDRFTDLYEAGDYTETEVFQAGVNGNVFIVTECRDPDARLAIFIAGNYQMRHAPALVRAATSRDEMYTHVKQLDGSHLGTFDHGDVAAFFPDPEEFYAFEQS